MLQILISKKNSPLLDVIFNLGKNSEGATCRVRLVFMTFHSTEPERSIWSMPDINSSSSLTNRTLLRTFRFLKIVQKCFAINTFQQLSSFSCTFFLPKKKCEGWMQNWQVLIFSWAWNSVRTKCVQHGPKGVDLNLANLN